MVSALQWREFQMKKKKKTTPMKSKSSQVICRSFIHSILDYSSTLLFFFFFFKTGRSSYCQVCRLPIFLWAFNCDMFFLSLSWRFSATRSFQTCQFSIALCTATRAHNIGVSIGLQWLSLHLTLQFYLIYIFSTNSHCLQWSAKFVGSSLILTSDVPSVTFFTDFIRYCWNERLI